MAIAFTSNQAATSFIKDASGYAGAHDFSANANFAKDIYFTGSGETLAAEDILITSRNTLAYTAFTPDLSKVTEVQAGKLRRAFIPDYNTFGVISSGAVADLINSPLAVAPYLPTTDTAATYAIYAYQGKATVPSNQCTILAGDGSFDNPMVFRYLNTQLPTITRTDGAEAVWCGYVLQGEIPFLPYFVQNPVPAADYLSVNPTQFSGRTGAIVLRYVEPKRAYGVRSNQPLLQIHHNATNAFDVIYRADTNQIRCRFFKQGLEATIQTIAENIDLTQPISLAVSWDNGLMAVSVNGQSKVFIGMSMSTTNAIDFSPTKITVMQPAWVANYNYAAVLNLITYKRSLSKAELDRATSF